LTRIPEIELAFCNACTADCYICSKKHGGHNEPLMSWKVFKVAVEHMKEIDFTIIQTGGDGDSFLNNIYIDALRELRKSFPKKKIVLYSNFALFNSDYADVIIEEHLLDEVSARIDSLDPRIFFECTGLAQDTVFKNIDYFMGKRRNITFNINYAQIKRYKDACREVLGVTPTHWREALDYAREDEYENVKKRFEGANSVNRIKLSLWAERINPAIKPMPELKCERQYCFDSTMYIWTDGDVGICGYDDGQDTFIYGNIMKESIKDLWIGPDRQKCINRVKSREVTGYPCVNPKACLFY